MRPCEHQDAQRGSSGGRPPGVAASPGRGLPSSLSGCVCPGCRGQTVWRHQSPSGDWRVARPCGMGGWFPKPPSLCRVSAKRVTGAVGEGGQGDRGRLRRGSACLAAGAGQRYRHRHCLSLVSRRPGAVRPWSSPVPVAPLGRRPHVRGPRGSPAPAQ